MGILDGIVAWIAEQVMHGLDLISTSVLGALGCNMDTFLRYFPAAETMYNIFVALAIGLILLNWVWQLFKNYGLSAGIEAEDPIKLSIRSIIFILLAYFSDEIVDIVLKIGGAIPRTIPPVSASCGCARYSGRVPRYRNPQSPRRRGKWTPKIPRCCCHIRFETAGEPSGPIIPGSRPHPGIFSTESMCRDTWDSLKSHSSPFSSHILQSSYGRSRSSNLAISGISPQEITNRK